jgi:hypothetical protein
MNDWEARLRKHQLVQAGGQPRHVPEAPALRALGLRGQVHPLDAHACLYSSAQMAAAWAQLNLDHYGHPSLGILVVEGGVIGVIDLRPALAAHGCLPVPPGQPDHY